LQQLLRLWHLNGRRLVCLRVRRLVRLRVRRLVCLRVRRRERRLRRRECLRAIVYVVQTFFLLEIDKMPSRHRSRSRLRKYKMPFRIPEMLLLAGVAYYLYNTGFSVRAKVSTNPKLCRFCRCPGQADQDLYDPCSKELCADTNNCAIQGTTTNSRHGDFQEIPDIEMHDAGIKPGVVTMVGYDLDTWFPFDHINQS